MPATAMLVAAGASTLLYYACSALGLGFLFMFIPTLPLFWLGLSRRDSSCLHAALISALALTLLTGPTNGLFFLLFLGLPTAYIALESQKYGQYDSHTIWYPLSAVFTRLVATLSFALLATTLFYASAPGGLPGLINQQVSQMLTELMAHMPADERAAVEAVVGNLAFLIFSISGWMWALSLYLHGWFVNRELLRRNLAIRPHFTIGVFPPPNWLISLLLISAIAALAGGVSLGFWGKASLILLTLPYFLLGLALVHAQAKKWPSGNFALVILYVMIFALLWVALFVAAYGFFYHVQLLNKYLSTGGTSSTS